MSGKHTPGPWEVKPHSPGSVPLAIGPASEQFVFTAQTTHGNDEANARLIAAAPEMLEALKAVDHFLTSQMDDMYDPRGAELLLRTVEQAAAKAEGGAS